MRIDPGYKLPSGAGPMMLDIRNDVFDGSVAEPVKHTSCVNLLMR